MRNRLFERRLPPPATLFNGPFFDGRTLFVLQFNRLPSNCIVGDLDADAAAGWLNEAIGSDLIKTWQFSFFDYEAGEVRFSRSVYLLSGNRVVEFGGYVEALHDGDFAWAHALVAGLAPFRVVPKEAPIGFARSGTMN